MSGGHIIPSFRSGDQAQSDEKIREALEQAYGVRGPVERSFVTLQDLLDVGILSAEQVRAIERKRRVRLGRS